MSESEAGEPILALYSSAASHRLYDEQVTELEHALQAGLLADEAGAPPELIVAALLHDIGHLVVNDLVPIDQPLTSDARHEEAGARYLRQWFDPRVCAPVALHVAAKRYLCGVDESYRATLSASSVRSLEVQGGPMSTPEQVRFRSNERWRDAVALRLWDDGAKRADMSLPSFDEWLPLINHVASSTPG